MVMPAPLGDFIRKLLTNRQLSAFPLGEQIGVERAERFMGIKAQPIRFKRSMARKLDKAGISYQQDYCARILKEKLKCSSSVIVIPYTDPLMEKNIVSLNDLTKAIC